MEALANELEKVLKTELEIHERLLDTARSMNEAIKTEQLFEVQAANRQYDELTCQIEALEEKRLEISDKITANFGLKGRLNLARTIELFPAKNKQRLAEAGKKLRVAVCRLRKTNASNRILLQESLYVISKTFELISAASHKFKGYKQLGKKDSSKINRTIINTVA
jgi:flagellar biosynthesis/type III secretory pathway chaperone